MTNARDFALYLVDRLHLPGWPRPLLKKQFVEPADPRDRALGEQISIELIKHVLTVQNLISHHAHRPLKQIDPLIQKILAIAMVQLRYLSRIPASAAVDEAVNQVRRLGLGRASGFVNAILRNATRDADPELPDQAALPHDYARLALSCPNDLYNRLVQQLSTAQALRICAHGNANPPTILRLNPGKTLDDLRQVITSQAPANETSGADSPIEFIPHQQAGMVAVTGARRTHFAAWSEAGVAQVQDPTAAATIGYCDIQPGHRVLDRCCGLGTKTLQICQKLQGQGHVVALDPSNWRIETLKSLVDRQGLSAHITCHAVGMMHDAYPGQANPPADELRFDRVLIDAPCSNSGVLARRPEARYAQSDRDLSNIIDLQRRIIDDTIPWVRPGGLLIYSTCSLWKQENQAQVARIIKRNPMFVLLHERLTLPEGTDSPAAYHDGGFVAILHHNPG